MEVLVIRYAPVALLVLLAIGLAVLPPARVRAQDAEVADSGVIFKTTEAKIVEMAPVVIRSWDAKWSVTFGTDTLRTQFGQLQKCHRCGDECMTDDTGHLSGEVTMTNPKGEVFFEGCIKCLESSLSGK